MSLRYTNTIILSMVLDNDQKSQVDDDLTKDLWMDSFLEFFMTTYLGWVMNHWMKQWSMVGLTQY